MQLINRLQFIPLIFTLVLLIAACSSENKGSSEDTEPDIETAESTAQSFSDNFDSGTTGARWGCTIPDVPIFFCNWEVEKAGLLDPTASELATTVSTRAENFVFQSPDPLAQDSNRGFSCERFTAKFEQEGTFAFNYFVNTAGPLGFQDGNNLEVNVWKNTVEFDPNFNEEIIIASEIQEEVLKLSGKKMSRSSTFLQPGHYDFEFCYSRNRSDTIGPDFAQIDDVVTCLGTSCAGEVPAVARCQADQGVMLVPDISTLPTHVITVNRVQGTANRYYVIINTKLLDLISAALGAGGTDFDILRGQIDGVRNVVLLDGRTCEIDERKSVLIEMSQAEIIDFVIAAGAVDAVMGALVDPATGVLADQFYEAAAGFIVGEIVGPIIEKFVSAIVAAIL